MSTPVLRVVRGTAAPEELAAVVALLVARSGSAPAPAAPPPARSRWSYGAGLRRPLPHGPGAWRAAL